VSLPHGFGHDPEEDENPIPMDWCGVSANDLTDELRLDLLTGTAAFNGVQVEVVALSKRAMTGEESCEELR
jgi:hypothetical protein